jgi:hypothetical protein
MDISAPEELAQSALTAEEIRKTLPLVCLKDDGSPKSEGSIKNILAGFNQMIKVGLLNESCLSVQMESEFQLTLQRVREYAKNHNKTQWPSFLNDVRAAANYIINFDTSDMTFAQTLTVLSGKFFGVSLSKTKLSDLLHELEPTVAASTYCQWMLGNNVPRFKRTTDAILSLDNKFNVNGALSSKVKKSFINKPQKDNEDDEVITFALPSSLKNEINTYIDFRVNGSKPKEMSYLKNQEAISKTDKRKLRQLKSINNEKWTVPTANFFESQIIFFAKYMQEQHPEDFKSISMSSIFNIEFIEGIESYILQKGTVNTGLKFLSWIKSECSKNSYASVYLYSHDEFCENIDDWIEELDLLGVDLQLMYKRLESEHEVLDGARNVEWILEKENPIDYVKTISRGLWHEAEYSSVNIGPTAAAMIFDLLLPCPIRATNVSDLRWMGKLSLSEIRALHKTKTCALYFDESKQCHTVFVHKSQLKNSKSVTIKSIIQPLYHLSDKIKQYLDVRKKHLEDRGWETDTLFPLMKVAPNIKKSRLDDLGNIVDFRIGRDGVYGLLSQATKAAINIYYPEENIEKGINPHGMRHLAASLFLRDNPDNFTGLATLLMDNLETVTRIYAKRDDKGNHEKIANWGANLMGLSNAA